MPEGDTLAKTAARLRPALAGHALTRFEAPRLRGDAPKLGTLVEGVEARGKHLLVHFADGLTLRTHLRMTGSWHVYRERRALAQARLPGPGGAGHRQRVGGGVLLGARGGDLPPGRRAPGRAGGPRTRPVPARSAQRRGARRHRGPGRRGWRTRPPPWARRCSTSASPRASATSTSPRPASPAGSIRPRPSPPSRTRPADGCGPWPPASSRPTSARVSAARTPPGWRSTGAEACPATAVARRWRWPATATSTGAPTGAPGARSGLPISREDRSRAAVP